MSDPWGKNVTVAFEDGIAWVSLNRPEKRNAMSPDLNAEMLATIDALETDERRLFGRDGPQGIFPRHR
jgi:feruloyl-CoA hydratase/lyase